MSTNRFAFLENWTYLPLIAIPYFGFCGGLFHAIYWSAFGLNGLGLISLADLFKFPAGNIAIILLTFILSILAATSIKEIFPRLNTNGSGTRNKNLNSFIIYGLPTVLSGYVAYCFFLRKEVEFITYIAAFSMLPARWLVEKQIVLLAIQSRLLRLLTFTAIIYLPVVSILGAIQRSCEVAWSIQYIEWQKSPNERLKLLGPTESFLIFTTANNDDLFFYRIEAADTLTLRSIVKKKNLILQMNPNSIPTIAHGKMVVSSIDTLRSSNPVKAAEMDTSNSKVEKGGSAIH